VKRRSLLANAVVAAVAASFLSGCAGTTSATPPTCQSLTGLILVAQSVPRAAYVPCLTALPRGWTADGLAVARGRSGFSLASDRAPGHPVLVSFRATCRINDDATTQTPRAPGVRTSVLLTSISPRHRGTMFDVFSGGCVTYQFDFERGPHIGLMEDLISIVQLQSRQELAVAVHQRLGVDLDPA
jgi:hypothetical protein